MEGRKDVRSMAAQRIVVVKKTCRCILNGSCEKKYCSTTWPTRYSINELSIAHERPGRTSRHTNSSSGRVVNMFNPKQKRATLIIVSSAAKLFRMLPCVLLVNTRNALMANVRHAARLNAVLTWVTMANRSSVGVRIEP